MKTQKTAKRYCIDCSADISNLPGVGLRCASCVKRFRQSGGADKNLAVSTRPLSSPKSELIAQEFGSRRLKVFEYQGQELATGGRFSIVVGKGQAKYIARRCNDCGHDDSHVRGQWAPAFAETWGRRQVERIILLCLSCYQRRCENRSSSE